MAPKAKETSPDTENGKTLGYLQVEKQKDSQTGSYAVGATPTDSNDAPTKFTLVKQASTAPGNADALQPVIIQASNPDGSGMGCMTYNAAQSSDLSLAPCDPSGKNGMSQLFGYDQKTHNISPLSDAPKGSSGDNTNAQPQPSGNNDVVLNFVSSSAQSAAIEDVSGPLNDASPTVTKTVTVTGTPTASPVNANVNAVPTANATGGPNSSASASDGSTLATSATAGASGSTLTTSTASTPTGAPDVVNVKVVQPPVSVSGAPTAPAAPSATPVSGGAPISGAPIKPPVPGAPNVPGGAAAANPSSAAPTTTMNAQDVASSIANPSATPSPAVNPSSSSASASPSSTASSTSAGSSTPTGTIMDSPSSERVLSIQSHVVYGYVGGKAAVFPLQCLGYDVDVVNTVHFSNHSGYGRFGGTRATADELTAVFEGMERNELMMPTRLLT
ncbi:hypothetical protein H0H93_008144, partial [Arthromyces matolae]